MDQTSPGAKHPLKLVVEGLRPSDQNALGRFRSYCAKAIRNGRPLTKNPDILTKLIDGNGKQRDNRISWLT